MTENQLQFLTGLAASRADRGRGHTRVQRPKAYAVLSGGGVKGAALAGALGHAIDSGIDFRGFAGASAGSLVAFLAALGLESARLKQEALEWDFVDLLCDGDHQSYKRMTELLDLPAGKPGVSGLVKGLLTARSVGDNLGFFEARRLSEYLLHTWNTCLDKNDTIETATFGKLYEATSRKLKVVASGLRSGLPVVFGPDGDGWNDSVIKAVRASMAYPVAFRPQSDSKGGLLSDGGISANLPLFLYEDERQVMRWPVIGFEVSPAGDNETPKSVLAFLMQVFDTAISSNMHLTKRLSRNAFTVTVSLSASAKTLDLGLRKRDREVLWDAGLKDAKAQLRNVLTNLSSLKSTRSQLQALYDIDADHIKMAVLRPLLVSLGSSTGVGAWRAYVLVEETQGKHSTLYALGDLDASKDTLPLIELPTAYLRNLAMIPNGHIASAASLRSDLAHNLIMPDSAATVCLKPILRPHTLETLAGKEDLGDAIGYLCVTNPHPPSVAFASHAVTHDDVLTLMEFHTGVLSRILMT